jgi:hypothetical protein
MRIVGRVVLYTIRVVWRKVGDQFFPELLVNLIVLVVAVHDKFCDRKEEENDVKTDGTELVSEDLNQSVVAISLLRS